MRLPDSRLRRALARLLLALTGPFHGADGQTGSGKTYTMGSIYELASLDLFEAVAALPETKPTISVSFVELAGEKCADMLNRGKQVQLLTGRDGAVHPYPVAEVTVQDADELLCFIRLACAVRATEATGVHNQSSRSHAVCRVFIDHGDGREGILQMIDLAGSEHRIDSAEHDAARRKEGAQINSSLAALKECVRCKAAGRASGSAGFLPYRKSKLTHLLRACFEDANPTVVVATVSPSSKDTEHSLNTIRHACIMDGQGTGALDAAPGGGDPKGGGTVSSHVTGGEVTKELIGELDITKLAREKRAKRLTEKGEGSGADDATVILSPSASDHFSHLLPRLSPPLSLPLPDFPTFPPTHARPSLG